MPRIVWTMTAYGAERGRVGERVLFAIEDRSVGDKPLFALSTTLPTDTGVSSWKATSPERLHVHAEKVLADFITGLGAAFPA